ncbi:ankyrin [Fusarium beomiforme]|uniref:Ankyrin n=1 Tax=Fusarium beomiforme TaxID=44412 RepID=A0A9P5E1G8_9HYPO|nr:ankyrin [Fusarium beomiforme]
MSSTLKDQFMTLASTGDVDQLRNLLASEKESLPQDTVQELLISAAKSSQAEVISFLLSQYPSTSLNEEIVRAAVNTGSIPLMQALLAKEPSVINMQFDMRGTPLIVACMGRQSIEFLRFLLEAGADPNQDPDAASYPLALVTGLYKDTAAIDLLLQHGARIEHSGALSAAARLGNESMMRYLLDRGARPESDAPSTGTGASPLHVAVKAGHVGVASILLQNGADPNATDGNGTSAIELARLMREQGKITSEITEVLEGK